jgi:hypothetical protein
MKGFKKNVLCSNWPQNPLRSPLTAQMRRRCRYPIVPQVACKWMTEMPSELHRHTAKCLQCSDSSKKQIFGSRVGYFLRRGTGGCWQIISTILAYYSIGCFRKTGGSDSDSAGNGEEKNVGLNTRLLLNSYRQRAVCSNLQIQEYCEWQ